MHLFRQLIDCLLIKLYKMNVEEIRAYCITKKGCTEEFPFDETTLVMKLGGKIFALLNLANNQSINLKCNPDIALELRNRIPLLFLDTT